jgi:multiple sugar transport system ATP-binding protein
VDARQAVTSEVRDLAEDVGDDRALEQLGSGSPRATVVGRFSPRTRVREGDQLEAAVDPHALHFFDAASGHAIDGSPRSST